MKDFIRNGLINTRNKNMKNFNYQYKCDDGDIISMVGNVKKGIANFEITRTKANGHRCSSVPVSQMPLTDETINKVVEIAVENL